MMWKQLGTIHLFPTLANLLLVIFRNDSIRFACLIKLVCVRCGEEVPCGLLGLLAAILFEKLSSVLVVI